MLATEVLLLLRFVLYTYIQSTSDIVCEWDVWDLSSSVHTYMHMTG